MTIFKYIYCYLQAKPRVGMLSGGVSGFLGATYNFITDEKILKLVSALGIYMGFLVALMTGIAKAYSLIKKPKIT